MGWNLNKKKESTSRRWCASRQEENESYGGKQSWSDVTPTNLGNSPEGVLNFCWTWGFFVTPCSWIDPAVAWSSSWTSPTYQAVWEAAQGEGGRGNPHPIVPAVHCGAQADVGWPGQLSAYTALLGSQLERSSCPVLARLVWTTALSLGIRF